MSIPFIDLKSQYFLLENKIRERIDRVLTHGRFIMGPEIEELEEALSKSAGVARAVCCSSGTDALLLPLLAKGIGPGDAVFTTPFTFIATAEVISLLGATPVFVDIDKNTFNIDADKLNSAIDAVMLDDSNLHPLPKRTGPLKPKAIIPVDMFGLPADYDRLAPIAQKYGLFLLADSAQSFGGSYKGRPVGSLGHATATSFFPAKPLGCFGDGGAVLTDDVELADIIVSLSLHGKGSEKYDNVRIGLNSRLDTIQAAILLPKLEILSQEIDARQRSAEHYSSRLKNLVKTPDMQSELQCAWAQYSILSDMRDQIMASLKEKGIPTMIYYPKPLHQQTAFQGLGYNEGDFPLSEMTSASIFSLPMHPYLKETEVNLVCDAITEFFK